MGIRIKNKFVPTVTILLSLSVLMIWLKQSNLDPNFVTKSSWNKNSTLDLIVKEYVSNSVFLSVKPRDISFLNSHRNPCWRNNDEKVQCLPAFYLAGFPKCGTGDVWSALKQHAQILAPSFSRLSISKWKIQRRIALGRQLNSTKEVRFWTRHPINGISFSSYTDLLMGVAASTESIVADGSVKVMFENMKLKDQRFAEDVSSETHRALSNGRILPVHLIMQYTPQAKFIVLLREPGERFYSDFRFRGKKIAEAKKFGANEPLLDYSPDHFHTTVVKEIDNFHRCLNETNSPAFCAISPDTEKSSLRIGLYATFLKSAMQLVPPQNIMLVDFHRYGLDKRTVLKEIFDFLDLKTDSNVMRVIPEVQVNKIRSPTSERKEMLSKTRQLLKEFYRPYNRELGRVIKSGTYFPTEFKGFEWTMT